MKTIAFQGELGAYSHEACLSARPNCKALPCKSFEEVISAVNNNVADLAEEEGHHPDIHFGWGYAKIIITTHAIEGLSENDFILAAKIDKKINV